MKGVAFVVSGPQLGVYAEVVHLGGSTGYHSSSPHGGQEEETDEVISIFIFFSRVYF